MKNKIVKRILIGVIIAAIAAGSITGGVRYQRNNRRADVYPVSSMNDGFWGDEIYSSGQVTNDYSQVVYVPKNDTIKEIFVEEGQHVKIGDKLLEMDTRAAELEYNMKVLEVENIKNQILLEQNNLDKWKKMKPGTATSQSEMSVTPRGAAGASKTSVIFTADASKLMDEPEKTGEAYNYITDTAVAYNQETADGSAKNPYRYLCTSEAYVTGAFIRSLAESGQCAVFEIYENNTISDDGPISSWTVDGSQVAIPGDDSKWSVADRTQIPEETPSGEDEKPGGNEDQPQPEEPDKPSDTPQDPDTKDPETKDPGTEDPSDGNWEDGGDGSYDDFSDPGDDGYTKEEIKEQIEESEQKLKELDLSKRKAELEVEKLKAKSTDGVIYATVNGEVKNLQDPDEREDDITPFLEVSGSEGLYVTGAISELIMDQIEPGQPVQVYSWESGITCEAQVTEVFDYPVSDANAYGDGNSNVSYYPYTAYIEDTAGLQNGEYVDLTMTVGGESGESSIYLPKAFVRTENGQSYVLKADENDRLKKQYVKTGRTIYGSSIEIKSGITEEDRIAFPYGKTAKEGIRAVDSDSYYN